MPYANNRGAHIYYQAEGTGPALVLQHGFSSSLESWYAPKALHTTAYEHLLDTWLDPIANDFRQRQTSGFVEGLNN
jgi:pimeloyl-ACP methyl ester carboxylesterase